MADFPAAVALTTSPDSVAFNEPPSVALFASASAPAVPSIFQRIYDSTAGYVYYTQETVNPAPAFDETTPNHTNNLVASTHEVIKEN